MIRDWCAVSVTAPWYPSAPSRRRRHANEGGSRGYPISTRERSAPTTLAEEHRLRQLVADTAYSEPEVKISEGESLSLAGLPDIPVYRDER